LNKTTYSLFIFLCFLSELPSQDFFSSSFSNANSYKQEEIKNRKIKSLKIREYSTSSKNNPYEVIKNSSYYLYCLEFNRNGSLLKNSEYVVVDSTKILRSRYKFSYNENDQPVKEAYYNRKDSLTEVKLYTYNESRLKKTEVFDSKKDLKKQTLYFYDKNLRNNYTIYHDFISNIHKVFSFKKESKKIHLTNEYELLDANIIEMNDSVLKSLKLKVYSITNKDKKGRKLKQTGYNAADNSINSEFKYQYKKSYYSVDKNFNETSSQLKNRNKYIINYNGQILESELLVSMYVNGERSFKMEKTIYKYDSNSNVIEKQVDGKIKSSYITGNDEKNNWIFIQELDSDKQLKNVYVREIEYY